jgi:ribosomal protein L7/L12
VTFTLFDWLMAFVSFSILIVGPLWAIDRRTRRLETMISDIVRHLGVSGASIQEPSDEVKALAKDPEKFILAIKAYRAQTGLGLREAKEVVERLAREFKTSNV